MIKKLLKYQGNVSMANLLTVEISEDISVNVELNDTHEWLISSTDVAEGYGLSRSGLSKTKS